MMLVSFLKNFAVNFLSYNTCIFLFYGNNENELSLSQNIGKGHQISVNKAYRLKNKEDILEIEVKEITGGAATPKGIIKYYSFKFC